MFSKFFTAALVASVTLVASGLQIHPNHHDNFCLDVKGNVVANGTAVQIYDCNGTGAQRWLIAPGEGKVRLDNTNFCLDAGDVPANNGKVTIQTCTINKRVGQDWFYTGDLRIAITGGNQCLDLTDGKFIPGTQVQTFQCTTGNTNQIWNTSPNPA